MSEAGLPPSVQCFVVTTHERPSGARRERPGTGGGSEHEQMTRFRTEAIGVSLGDRIRVDWLGTPVTVRAAITLSGAGSRYVAYFITEDSPVPPPFYRAEGKTAGVFLPFHEFEGFRSLVRNEAELFVHLDTERPEQSRIGTEFDPLQGLTLGSGTGMNQGRSVAKAVG